MAQLRIQRRTTWIVPLFMAGTICLYLLHFVHLRADFPNHSPWMDWSKYTDEGWYGDAAIRHYLRGRWLLPGDFNPAVALPVWPLLEAAMFHFAGVGITSARALTVLVFGCALVGVYLLLTIPGDPGGALTRKVSAVSAVLLLTASSFVYAFTRVAIVEPLLVAFGLSCILVAYRIRFADRGLRRALHAAILGCLIALTIATKTTAIFLLPAFLWMLWSSAQERISTFLRDAAIVGSVAACLWGAYLAFVAHYNLLEDFRYLFSANQYTGITRDTFVSVLTQVFRDGMWMGTFLYPACLLAFATAFKRSLWKDAVFTSMVLWVAGYTAFMVYHANFQPRYYLVVAIPLVALAIRAANYVSGRYTLAIYAIVPIYMLVLTQEIYHTVSYVRRPEYSFQAAAQQLERIVQSDPAHSQTVLSISGSTLSLMTGLPSICDDFGTMDLEDRIATYKPGWFVAWNYVEDDKMDALSKFYHLTRIAAFPAMDDPDRNLLIVYRLDARAGVEPRRGHGTHGKQQRMTQDKAQSARIAPFSRLILNNKILQKV